jgi:hypothetical protein
MTPICWTLLSVRNWLLLMNDEFGPCALDLIIPDITKACPMVFPWTAASARRATTGSGGAPLR